MIIKITNKDKNFYTYMGKFFGSRLIQKQTNDRIYDDDNKIWYIFLDEGQAKAFVSISKNVLKNIYTTKCQYLEDILKKIKEENNITYSIVTNIYLETYQKCDFRVSTDNTYKNFVTIYM